jgi:putative ABC transport system permease protein
VNRDGDEMNRSLMKRSPGNDGASDSAGASPHPPSTRHHLPTRHLPTPGRLVLRDLIAVGVVGIRGRRMRAVLSGLGIAIGVAAMVAVLGISQASKAELLSRIDGLGTNLLTAQAGRTLLGQQAELPADAAGMVRRLGPVTSATATGAIPGTTVRRTPYIPAAENGGIAVVAARPDLLTAISGRLAAGRFLDEAESRYPAVVLGAAAAHRLGVAPGAQLWLGGRYFTVVGVLQAAQLAPEIDWSALVGWPAAQTYLGFDGNPSTVYERSADQSVASVAAVLARTVDPEHPDQVNVTRPSDALTAQLAAKDAFVGLFLGLGSIALLVGGVGIANTMVISVLERRSEIGMRRALGASRGQIRTQFVTESAVLSGAGGLAGVLLGLGIAVGYAASRGWTASLPVGGLAAGVGAALLVGTVAGLYPAARAARLAPTEALR